MYLKDSNAASHFVNSLILFALSRTGSLFAHALQKNVSNRCNYMEESVLLGTKPLVDAIRHFIRDPSGVFSVCHLCECRIVQ